MKIYLQNNSMDIFIKIAASRLFVLTHLFIYVIQYS